MYTAIQLPAVFAAIKIMMGTKEGTRKETGI